MKKIVIIFVIVILLCSPVTAQYVYPKRELRGVWIATVSNIDWPRSNKESTTEQIEELKKLFDKLQDCGINTIFFQVRTECDALYNSPFEPWSYWLTGKQGKAPSPYYDPLKVAVEEAHSRGISIHAWLNPLRISKKDDNYKIASDNILITHPKWILKFPGYKMLNPGIPEVRHYVASIVSDIVRRYNVDGINFDDYFYPYSPKIKNQDIQTYKKYGMGTTLDEWRRNNINYLIAEVNDSINAISPKVRFGVSPFGIIQNKYADTKGFEGYNILYCDPLTWIKQKDVDYLVPQLYWEIGNHNADYKSLLLWWGAVARGVHLYTGLYSTLMASPQYKGAKDELEKQIRINRQIIRIKGTVFYSAKSISDNYSGLADSLKIYFKYPALIPQMLAKDSVPPLPPINSDAEIASRKIILKWQNPGAASDGDSVFIYVIYKFREGENADLDEADHILKILPSDSTSLTDSIDEINPGIRHIYYITSVDKNGNESQPLIMAPFKRN